jgi:Uma2 family endonuclease
MNMATATQLITAEEYARSKDLGYPTELVRGEIVRMHMPVPRHGQICSRIVELVSPFVRQHHLGHVLCNDAGIITERDPDTVRGGDVWFISYDKLPPGPLPDEYLQAAPDIVFEVLSPSDRRGRLHKKISEYLEVGVAVVCVVDPASETVQLCTEQDEDLLELTDELTFPQQLPGFRVAVHELFA